MLPAMKPAILLAFIALLVVGMARAETVWRVSAKNGNDAIGDNHPFISSAGLAILNPMNVGRYLLLGGLALAGLGFLAVWGSIFINHRKTRRW